MNDTVEIIGAGLAGCEAALYLSKKGIKSVLYEAKPLWKSPAHTNEGFAEIVCSNSFKSILPDTAGGTLKRELELLGCRLLEIARAHAVPSGSALAVERDGFSRSVTELVNNDKNITVKHEIRSSWNKDVYTVIAAGPLLHGELSDALRSGLGGFLHFYDAASPIVSAEDIDFEYAFYGSRYNKGGDDYLNCPMTEDEYRRFYEALICAPAVPLKQFEDVSVFEGCMPVEVLAKRGYDALRFAMLRPVGFIDPRTQKRPFALLQLRKENVRGELFNLVGFQTNLTFKAQREVFRLIPALKNAEFVRYGVMHRNSFIDAPNTIDCFLRTKAYPMTFIAGQLSGVEGYVESIATGLIAAVNIGRLIQNKPLAPLPKTTVLGALLNYLQMPNKDFQPMNANFGIIEPLETHVKNKQSRKQEYYIRSQADLTEWIKHNSL